MDINEIVVPTGKILITMYNVITKKYDQDLVDNMFVTAGKNALAASISGTTSDNKGIITYCALGTSSVAPALGDTGLVRSRLFLRDRRPELYAAWIAPR